MMDAAGKLGQLLTLLEGLGVEVRTERIGGTAGGLCSLGPRRVFFDDLDADEATRAERAVAALAELPEAEQTYLPPAIRERVDHIRDRPGR